MKILLFILLGLLLHQVLVFCYLIYMDLKEPIELDKYFKIFSPIPYYFYAIFICGGIRIIKHLFAKKCYVVFKETFDENKCSDWKFPNIPETKEILKVFLNKQKAIDCCKAQNNKDTEFEYDWEEFKIEG